MSVGFSLNLVGCTTNTPAGGDAATAVGTGPAMAQDAMPEFCQGAAATQYGTTVDAISTDPPVQTDGGFEVKGTSSGGSQGSRVFNCRFDSSGKFVGVMAGNGAS
jgi:hypothetical protein